MKEDLVNDSLIEDNAKIVDESNFLLHSKSLFMTYPQCHIDEVTFFNLLKDKVFLYNRSISIGVCSSEYHKNSDGKHIHVYIELDKKIKTKDNRKFDIFYDGKVYHPNIQKPFNKIGVIKYVCGLTKKKEKDEKHVYEYNINVEKYLNELTKCITREIIRSYYVCLTDIFRICQSITKRQCIGKEKYLIIGCLIIYFLKLYLRRSDF